MGKYVLVGMLAFIIGLVVGTAAMSEKNGCVTSKLSGKFEVDVYSKALQPFVTVVMTCLRREMIMILPLTVVDPWFED